MPSQINVPKDCVKESALDIGAATVTLTGAVTGFRTFAAAHSDNDKVAYRIVHSTVNEWEVGEGTYSAGTVTRVNILASSTGAKVTFTAGTVVVSEVHPANDIVVRLKLASTANGNGASTVGLENAAATLAAADVEAGIVEVSKRHLAAVADAAAMTAIAAAKRSDGCEVVDLTTSLPWVFDADDASVASDWVRVPDAGTGRWLRKNASLTDLAGVTATTGANLVGYDDSGNKTTAATTADALDELYLTQIKVASKSFGFADMNVADTTGTIDFAAALPAGAIVIGAGINVTAIFDNVTDTADVSTHLGIKSGDADGFGASLSLNAVAKVGAAGLETGALVGAITPSLTWTASVNGSTLTKGTAVAYVAYVPAF